MRRRSSLGSGETSPPRAVYAMGRESESGQEAARPDEPMGGDRESSGAARAGSASVMRDAGGRAPFRGAGAARARLATQDA